MSFGTSYLHVSITRALKFCNHLQFFHVLTNLIPPCLRSGYMLSDISGFALINCGSPPPFGQLYDVLPYIMNLYVLQS